MKLIRFGNPGEEKPGLQLEDGRRIDASATCGSEAASLSNSATRTRANKVRTSPFKR